MKKTLALLLALVMVFALAACSSDSGDADTTPSDDTVTTSPDNTTPDDTTEPDDEPTVELTGDPIKIGHIVDMTGVEAMTGQEAAAALDFAVKLIEADGGIGGHPIEIIVADSQSSASVAADQARKLIESDNVLCILGPTQAGHKGSVAGVVAELGVPAIYYNATPFGMAKGNEYVVSSGGGTSQLPTVMADYAYNEMGWRTVYTITQDNTGGQNYMNPFIENFTALGGTVVQDMWVPAGVSDFTSYLASMTADVDGLVAWFSGSDAMLLWQTWYNMGLDKTLPIIGSMHGGFTDYFILESLAETDPAIVDAILETAIVPIAYNYAADNEENAAFVEAWTEEFGTIPGATNLPGATYGALYLVKTAYEAIEGDVTSEALYEQLQVADVHVPEGHLKFNEGVRLATKDIYVVKPVELDSGYNYEILKTYTDVGPNGLTVG